MNDNAQPTAASTVDPGMYCVAAVAAYYRIPSDPARLAKDLNLKSEATTFDILRGAFAVGLRARIVKAGPKRIINLPMPAVVRLKENGAFRILSGKPGGEVFRIFDPVTRSFDDVFAADLPAQLSNVVILIARKLGGPGSAPPTFGLSWFLPSIWRYRKPLANVVVASLFIQLLALATPIFFQVVIDKVLGHKGYSTLFVLVGGLAAVAVFDMILQYIRTYALSHTTNRIDVELGSRLFHHLLKLPVSYFETRPTGQTVARIRELETIRSFLTGQALFSVLDLVFTIVFIVVLFAYSWKLALIVTASIPVYLLIGVIVRPPLRERVKEKFNRGAESQQFLVESVVGAQTIKASAVEPAMQSKWEEKLAAYVSTSFDATMLGAKGQGAIQWVSKIVTAVILLFGAKSVMDGELSVGSLVAFNMLAAQVTQPVLRLSQLWQDFQQVQVSVDRLGDILNSPPEPVPPTRAVLAAPRGDIQIRNVNFRYRPGMPLVLKDVSLDIKAGESIGIVGTSGSGKSTLTKLLQRFYIPEEGALLVDGNDISHVDPAWLRSHLGVVLQESMLFHGSVHENIAFANPSLPRAVVINAARSAGADEFIVKMSQGYDTMIEERGTNLSGGQRQRLAIARALVQNPPILIFDEATSALDYRSEQIVHDSMRRISKGRTTIVIAHRLATVRHCDRIIGMTDGKIVEMGTHEELLAKGGLYADLWTIQNDGKTA